MSISRSSLIRGPGYVTYNTANFFTQKDIAIRHAPTWEKVPTSNYGRIDDWKKDLVIKIPLKLWGAYENLGILFPAIFGFGASNPVVPGASVFGSSLKSLVIQGRNGDVVTYPDAAITKLANLYLGVDSDLFAADVEFTALLQNSHNPEDAGAYLSYSSSAYSEASAAFSKTNYRRQRFTFTWGSFAGFSTAVVPQKGVALDWSLDLKPVLVDGLGTVDMVIGEDGLIANAKCVPVGPTLAQIYAQTNIAAAHGTLAGGIAGELAFTGSAGSLIKLENAYIFDSGVVFGIEPLRIGEMTWRTTTGISGGTQTNIASIA